MSSDTRIGRNCFIGAHSIILPGVTIGDGSVVGAGSVVTRDVPPRSAMAGNPARTMKSDVVVVPDGRLLDSISVELRGKFLTSPPVG